MHWRLAHLVRLEGSQRQPSGRIQAEVHEADVVVVSSVVGARLVRFGFVVRVFIFEVTSWIGKKAICEDIFDRIRDS